MESDGKKTNRTECPNPNERNGRFPERLKEAIGGLSVRAFAQKVGVSGTVIGNYLSGKSEPTRPTLIAMAVISGVTIQWLATGKGPKLECDFPIVKEDLLIASIISVDYYLNSLKDAELDIEIKAKIYTSVYDDALHRGFVYYPSVKEFSEGYIRKLFYIYSDNEIVEEVESLFLKFNLKDKIDSKLFHDVFSRLCLLLGYPPGVAPQRERGQILARLKEMVKNFSEDQFSQLLEEFGVNRESITRNGTA